MIHKHNLLNTAVLMNSSIKLDWTDGGNKAEFQNGFKKWLNLDEWSHCSFMRNQHQC